MSKIIAYKDPEKEKQLAEKFATTPKVISVIRYRRFKYDSKDALLQRLHEKSAMAEKNLHILKGKFAPSLPPLRYKNLEQQIKELEVARDAYLTAITLLRGMENQDFIDIIS